MLDPTLLLSILTRTHALIAKGWCQGDYAQFADGTEAFVDNPEACRWSLIGALHVVLRKDSQSDLLPQVNGYLHRFLPTGINYAEDYSDLPTTTQADVLVLLERAMAGVGK